MHINFDHPRSPTSQKPSCLLVTRSVHLQCKVAATALQLSTSTLVPYLPSLHVSLSPCSSVSFSHVTLQLTYGTVPLYRHAFNYKKTQCIRKQFVFWLIILNMLLLLTESILTIVLFLLKYDRCCDIFCSMIAWLLPPVPMTY
jgi:hypothetical protein